MNPSPGVDNEERRKISPYRDLNSSPSTVHPVASRYTELFVPRRVNVSSWDETEKTV
jgi:hypothetical protein